MREEAIRAGENSWKAELEDLQAQESLYRQLLSNQEASGKDFVKEAIKAVGLQVNSDSFNPPDIKESIANSLTSQLATSNNLQRFYTTQAKYATTPSEKR